MSRFDTSHVVMLRKRFSNLDFWRELITASRFGLVGIFATAVHITIVWLVLTQTGLTPILANTLAFTIAFGISFLGNYVWTFRSPGSPRRAMFRFFLISVSAFSANTLMLSFLVQGGWFPPVVSAIISASVVPVISFTASRFWGFKDHAEAKR
ncbi:MAG: GtrA family protein [Candidatus Thiodiazotropha sp.]|jgi:putative flippase GtrA